MKTLKILLHILFVIPLCLLILISSKRQQEKMIQFWCKRLLSIFKIKVEVLGLDSYLSNQKQYLMVANHISWIDIIVIQSIKPSIFVAKSDVASWPLFGWVAQMIGTIFIKREKVSDIKKALKKMKFPLGRYILTSSLNVASSSLMLFLCLIPCRA